MAKQVFGLSDAEWRRIELLLPRGRRRTVPDKTEMVTYCLAPKGESAESRCRRLRQYEDFFSPSGMATPDDACVYEECQDGQSFEQGDGWLDGYSRGIGALRSGADAYVKELDLQPNYAVEGVSELANEVGFHAYYREWRRRVRRQII